MSRLSTLESCAIGKDERRDKIVWSVQLIGDALVYRWWVGRVERINRVRGMTKPRSAEFKLSVDQYC